MSFIHPTAIVAHGATIGTGVRIGPWCQVGADVVIEDGAHLISQVVVEGRTRLGAGVVLFPFCTVGMAPQDLKYKGEPTGCEIGPRTQVREHVTIHRGTPNGVGVTRVGADCMLMATAHVAHDCQLGNNVIVANNAVMGGHVVIGDGAIIGGASAIHQFVRVGRGAMIGGMAGAAGDVIPFGSVMGQRKGGLAGINIIGLRRRGFDRAAIHRIRAAVRGIFLGEGVFADRLAETRALYGDDPIVAEILQFIDHAGPRGLIRAVLSAQDDDDD